MRLKVNNRIFVDSKGAIDMLISDVWKLTIDSQIEVESGRTIRRLICKLNFVVEEYLTEVFQNYLGKLLLSVRRIQEWFARTPDFDRMRFYSKPQRDSTQELLGYCILETEEDL